jgi:diaminopimelate decarboxylase
MREFNYKDGRLQCEAVLTEELAVRFGTPLYVYSKNSIIDHCRHIENAFGDIDHLSCYAVKANANREILRLIAQEGIGAGVGSAGELQMALRAGFPPDKITYSGVGKRDDEIEFALSENILSLNVESEEELGVISAIAKRLGVRARILLRVSFDLDAGTHPYITTGKKSNKFGVESSDAAAILQKALTLPGIDVLGIHNHIGSQITNSEAFVAAADQARSLVQRLRSAGIPIHHLNFGGGFGVQYHDFVTHPSLPLDEEATDSGITTVALLQAILLVLKETKCKILIEPGRSIVAHAGVLLARVLYTKENSEKRFVIVDAGMNDLIRPSLYNSYHQVVPLRIQDAPHETVDVVGPLCESGDFIALDRKLPRVGRGDYLAVLCSGAYGYALSSNYNARPRPAEVLVDGAEVRVIRARESVDQL